MRRPHVAGLGAFVLVVLAGSALGQEAPARERPPERPPLQGPQVKEHRAPHVDDQFGEGMQRGRMGMQIPMKAYSDVIDKLRGEKAPADLRLSEDQEQRLGAIEQEFRQAARAFAQEQREQREGQPKRGEGEPRRGDGQRRERLQEMAKGAPRPGDYQTRIWAVLNEKQQSFVKVELDKVKDDLQKRRSEEAMQRKLNQKDSVKPGGPARPGAGAPEEAGKPAQRERGMRLIRRIAQLPEAERDQLLSRLEAELDRRGVPDAPEGDKPRDK